MKSKFWVIFLVIVAIVYCGKGMVIAQENTNSEYVEEVDYAEEVDSDGTVTEEVVIEEPVIVEENEDMTDEADSDYVFGEIVAITTGSIKVKQEEYDPETYEEIVKEYEVVYDDGTTLEGIETVGELGAGNMVYISYITKDNINKATNISLED
ncbi:MAG: hypothetical protein HQL29_03130 [Candidatus Omnitrophica bacterium]|nr:hypothetical protein [Candidatus Omnitrophota bacterium]